MKDMTVKISILIVSMVIGLALCETVIRIVAPQRLAYNRPLYDPDEDLVFKLRKNIQVVHAQYEFNVTETTNSLGLRDREIDAKMPGSHRILSLGDSYAFGHGVSLEDTYAKQLESSLDTATGSRVEVINAGVPAYSLIQELRYLRKYGLTLEPDTVLLGFYIGNDFYDSLDLYHVDGSPTVSVDDGQLISRKTRDTEQTIWALTKQVRRYLAIHSHLYTLLRDRSSEILIRLRLRHIAHVPEFCSKEFTPKMRAQWQYTQELLLELATMTRQQGIRLVVVIIPTIYQVHKKLWKEHASIFHIDQTHYDMEQPQRLLKNFCAQHDIDYADVLDFMRREGETTSLFYRVDGHMNAEGHSVVAHALATFFTDHLNADDGSVSAQRSTILY